MGKSWMLAGLLLPAALYASPLDPDARRVFINGGDTLVLQDLGDEHYSETRTDDGFLVVGDGKGTLYYAGEDGKPSKFKAKGAHKRSSAERAFLNGLDRDKVFKTHRKKNLIRDGIAESGDEPREARAPWVPTLSAPRPSVLPASHHSSGELYFPIVLVAGEADNRENLDSASMYARLNQEGYTEDDYLGSVRDYFIDQSSGVFKPHFDVFLVSESEPFESYIGKKEAQLMKRALLSMLEKYPEFDASKYDSDKDGEVDAFGVLYAGERYYSKNDASQHLGGFKTTLKKYSAVVEANDGIIFNTCFIIDQGKSHISQFLHEFSHTMGLKDHYCVWASWCTASFSDSSFQAPGTHAWDVMATGLYNGNYRKPPNYSAFERNFMGWLNYTDMEDDDQVKVLPPLGSDNFALMSKVNDNEWYVFENRQMEKWDSGLPNHGMLVWHIDFKLSVWNADSLNDHAGHQRVDIVEAGPYWVLSQNGGYYTTNGNGARMKDDPFPGSQNVTELSPVSAWDGSAVLDGLFNIVEKDYNVCFAVKEDIVVRECEFVPPPSSSSASESSSSSEPESSSALVPSSSSALELSSSSEPESSSSSEPESSNSSEPQSSNSSLPESSSSEESSSSMTIALRGASGVPAFRVTMEGNMLFVNSPESGMKTLRVFDIQGHALVFTKFASRAFRLDLGAVVRGTPLVIRLESDRGIVGHFKVLPK